MIGNLVTPGKDRISWDCWNCWIVGIVGIVGLLGLLDITPGKARIDSPIEN